MNEKTSHYLYKCLRNKPTHMNGTLLGVMMESNEGDYAPFLLFLVLLFFSGCCWWLSGSTCCCSRGSGVLASAPPPPNPKLQPRSSGIINRLVWIEAEAELEEE